MQIKKFCSNCYIDSSHNTFFVWLADRIFDALDDSRDEGDFKDDISFFCSTLCTTGGTIQLLFQDEKNCRFWNYTISGLLSNYRLKHNYWSSLRGPSVGAYLKEWIHCKMKNNSHFFLLQFNSSRTPCNTMTRKRIHNISRTRCIRCSVK
jgi:hypothetical protein